MKSNKSIIVSLINNNYCVKVGEKIIKSFNVHAEDYANNLADRYAKKLRKSHKF